MPAIDREQITVAAFLNMYIAWETFLESTTSAFLSGSPTINGTLPAKFAAPPTSAAAREMIVGINRFFDYGNHQIFGKMVSIYFDQGAPFQPHLNAIRSTLDDMKAMRNASAHVSTTTQLALEAVALRLLGRPSPGVTLYQLLTAPYPRGAGNSTVFQNCRDLLITTAELIANG